MRKLTPLSLADKKVAHRAVWNNNRNVTSFRTLVLVLCLKVICDAARSGFADFSGVKTLVRPALRATLIGARPAVPE